MNDPLKDFVTQHRAAFDDLEAPVLNLQELKAKINSAPEVPKKRVLSLNANKWLVAASLLVLFTTSWLFFNRKDKTAPAIELVKQQTEAPADKVDAQATGPSINVALNEGTINRPLLVSNKPHVEQKKQIKNIWGSGNYTGLQDSTSASSRLLAIIEIEKAGKMDRDMLDRLAITLNNDPNTNVRLAALNLMEKYSQERHVSSLLVSALDQQDDPIVQLGLLGLLGKMKNVKIDKQLVSLANNPQVFAAVRDEAYSILLNQNKL